MFHADAAAPAASVLNYYFIAKVRMSFRAERGICSW